MLLQSLVRSWQLSAPLVAGSRRFCGARTRHRARPERACRGERLGPGFLCGRAREMGPLGVDNPTVTFEDLPETLHQGAHCGARIRISRQHMGVDPVGVTRAATGLARGQFAGGGSTLSQQLAKNVITGCAPDHRSQDRGSLFRRRDRERWPRRKRSSNPTPTPCSSGVVRMPPRALRKTWFTRNGTSFSLSEYAFLGRRPIRHPRRFDPLRHRERAVARRDRCDPPYGQSRLH